MGTKRMTYVKLGESFKKYQEVTKNKIKFLEEECEELRGLAMARENKIIDSYVEITALKAKLEKANNALMIYNGDLNEYVRMHEKVVAILR